MSHETSDGLKAVWMPMGAGGLLALLLVVITWGRVSGYSGGGLDLLAVPHGKPTMTVSPSAAAALEEVYSDDPAAPQADPVYELLLKQWEMVSDDRARELFTEQDPLWQALLHTVQHGRAVEVLADIYRYRERRPTNPFDEQLEAYRVSAIDRIWWERIAQLLTSKSQGPTPEGLHEIEMELQGMGYAGDEIPRYRDRRQIDRLRTSRDEARYLLWQSRWLRPMEIYGRLPWEMGRGE